MQEMPELGWRQCQIALVFEFRVFLLVIFASGSSYPDKNSQPLPPIANQAKDLSSNFIIALWVDNIL